MGLGRDLKYPFNEEQWYKTIGLGMLFEYFTWLILPGLFLAGYYIRVMQHVTAGHEEPPEFGEYKELTVNGIKAFVIIAAYFLVPIIASWLIVGPSIIALLSGEGGGIAGILTGMLMSAGLMTLFGYGGVAGLVKFSRTGSIGSAFSPSLLGIVFSGPWIKAWIKVVIVSGISSIVSTIIAVIPGVNFTHIVLIPLQVKYFFTVFARIFAVAYAEAADEAAEVDSKARSGSETSDTEDASTDSDAPSATATEETATTAEASAATDGTATTGHETAASPDSTATATEPCQACDADIDADVDFCPVCGTASPFQPASAGTGAEAGAGATADRQQGQRGDTGAAATTVSEVTASVEERVGPESDAARQLCRVLADTEASDGEIQSAIEGAVEELETAHAVEEAVRPAKRRSTVQVFENIKQDLEAQRGQLPAAVTPLVDRLLDAKRDLEQQESDHSEQVADIRTLCTHAADSGDVSFESREPTEQLGELATQLERGDLTIGQPTASVSDIASTVQREAQPSSGLSRELLDVLRDPSNESAASATIGDCIDVLDEYWETREMLSDIEAADVRRRLESLDRELRDHDTTVHSQLANRVRELESMVDDTDHVDDIQLYAIYQEISFYDRTLLPQLSRASQGDHSDDGRQLLDDVERRIEAIQNDYISVRADHNHSIPRHFLGLAESMSADAREDLETNPDRAAGVLLATDRLLDRVESLYQQNEYSVMLRRLRG